MNNLKEFTACSCEVVAFNYDDVITTSSIVLEDDDFLVNVGLMS